mmetsp:Transcript_18534/g.60189  ORF Transcript_18534/g.60189 Transcript_18534/m.60189 type:complete len:308 (-) Transcript_18534:2128-3051(-)
MMGRSSLSSPRQRPRLSLDIPSRSVSASDRWRRSVSGGQPKLALGACGHVGLQLCWAPALRAGRVRRREQRAHDDVLRRGCAAVESALPCGVLLAEDAQVDVWDEGLGLERLARDRRDGGLLSRPVRLDRLPLVALAVERDDGVGHERQRDAARELVWSLVLQRHTAQRLDAGEEPVGQRGAQRASRAGGVAKEAVGLPHVRPQRLERHEVNAQGRQHRHHLVGRVCRSPRPQRVKQRLFGACVAVHVRVGAWRRWLGQRAALVGRGARRRAHRRRRLLRTQLLGGARGRGARGLRRLGRGAGRAAG